VPASTIEQYLSIHQGDAKAPFDVAKALISPTNKAHLVDTIYFSVGVYPKFAFSLVQPFPLTDPTICESAMAAIFTAIDQLGRQGIASTSSAEKLGLIAISATASADLRRGLPWPWIMAPLYAWLLSGPQTDKLKMEKLVLLDAGSHIESFVIIRPAILTDGVESGVKDVRVGWEWYVDGLGEREKAPGPAKGWTISRRDLGAWVFRKAVVEGGWDGRAVSLCY
jgi:hypothetical protein